MKSNLALLKACAVSVCMLATIPSFAAEKYEIAVVAKVTGIPWFNRMEVGVKEAAQKLNVNAYQTGASTPDPAAQVKVIEDLIAKNVNAIIVVPNDASVLEPVLKRARDRGIVVLTHESPDQQIGQWDIETIDSEKYAQANMDELAQSMDGKGGYAIYVGSLTVPLHNAWADYAIKYQKEKYPEMFEVTSRLPVAESIDRSFSTTQELIKTYPQMKGIIGFGSLGPIGAGQALSRKRGGDKITVVGIAMPSQAAPYLIRGDIKKALLWDPKDAGYAVVTVAEQLLRGQPVTADLEIEGLGKADVDMDNKVIRFNKILEVTKDNAKSLGF
ncbi:MULTISPECIES: autoinducer 2 ABC transporter substrate-binding protein [unclassified Brenneria]|uniref:autoinducer 2 ABC transporter substrate-binding protein n=1 Tax=unclassified Brenneria TaxID=2634434 RepID=UPI0029C2E42E|nr:MULTISPECIES: autoinducer 2 ABC transporter substrate-binding protein [unclassified Brenneria]MDX5629934.1 autoinducer 2 ABC transporter substrate-binding protein [Brenneria sp. L3-3Z]MDX5697080.1 autoinducer 2 ABC transporter substrate-binding protein [Brenneria sp. L4-2C]